VRAALLREVGAAFELADIAVPETGPGEIRVRVGAAGVCHSDLHLQASAEAPAAMGPAPWILGHEIAGWIDELGAGVSGVEVGQPVAIFGGWGCGQCRTCLGGEEQICATRRWPGRERPGGYAEQLLVPTVRYLVPIDGLDPIDMAPLTDAALTPYRAVKKALPVLVPGTTAVVIGAGGLGQYAIQLLFTLSPAQVVVVDPSETKRDLAQSLGADLVLDPTADDCAAEIGRFAGRDGPAAILDFVGVDDTVKLALGAVGRRGMAIIVGLGHGSAPFSFFSGGAEAIVTTSHWGSRNELAEVIALARAGRISGLVERHDLGDINVAFARLQAGQVEGRAVLVP
jgi:alcohol dehydrogenase, propanol-preferring